MITAASLNSQKSKDLAQLAKKKGVEGWHSMRKDQLIKALLKIAKQKASKKDSTLTKNTRSDKQARSSNRSTVSKNGSTSDSAIAKRIRIDRERKENLKNLAIATGMGKRETPPSKDRIILIVRDSFWLQAYWEVTRATVQRAKVALAGHWHDAKPVLRLLEITSDGNTNSVEDVVQEVEIHSGVNNWYLSTDQSGRKYRIAIGYTVPDGKFHLIAKSNQVNSPASNKGEMEDHWTDITNDVEKYYALSGGHDPKTVSADLQAVFEEKSLQPMNAPAFERLGSGISTNGHCFKFQVDAHMIVYGTTDPEASVTVAGEPVRLQTDGSFALRLDLPDRRQVLPVVAASRDGTQQRTTVLAVERNTKVMEPISNDLEL